MMLAAIVALAIICTAYVLYMGRQEAPIGFASAFVYYSIQAAFAFVLFLGLWSILTGLIGLIMLGVRAW